MPVYLIANVKVTDDAWIPGYAAVVHDIAKKHGGRYLSRSGNIHTIEGEAPDTTLIALIEFPDVASVEAFANDPDYRPHGERAQGRERQQLLRDRRHRYRGHHPLPSEGRRLRVVPRAGAPISCAGE